MTLVSTRRLLLVEDEPGLVMTMTDRLELEGYEVESVMDANKALDTASSNAYDAILPKLREELDKLIEAKQPTAAN